MNNTVRANANVQSQYRKLCPHYVVRWMDECVGQLTVMPKTRVHVLSDLQLLVAFLVNITIIFP